MMRKLAVRALRWEKADLTLLLLCKGKAHQGTESESPRGLCRYLKHSSAP